MSVMRKNLPWILPLFFLLPVTGYSQLLQGRVLSETGTAASGVTVQFMNKTGIVSTKPDGSFRITVTKVPDTLVFTATGYETYKVVITEKNLKDPKFEVVLLSSRSALSEMAVMGFSSKRADAAPSGGLDYSEVAPGSIHLS